MSEAEAQAVLDETLLRWGLHEVTSAEVVQDAAVAVAQGVGAPWVLALACLPSDASANDVEDALEETPADGRVPFLPRGNSEAVLAAGFEMARRCVAGRLGERDLARWAHAVIGHGRSDELEALVRLDDAYDTAHYSDLSIESIDKRVRADAERLVRLHQPPL